MPASCSVIFPGIQPHRPGQRRVGDLRSRAASPALIIREGLPQRSTARSLAGWEQHTKRLPAAGGSSGSGA
jgi:hypothetical protein